MTARGAYPAPHQYRVVEADEPGQEGPLFPLLPLVARVETTLRAVDKTSFVLLWDLTSGSTAPFPVPHTL
jgi:hypothetical protein